MSKLFSNLCAALILSTACLTAAHAHDYTIGEIKVAHPWTRPTAPAQAVGGGFMSINNTGKTDDTLIAIEWADSKTVELHTHAIDNGVMKMRQIPKIAVQAGKTVELKPGSFHVMFIDLNKPLLEGEKHQATLVFEKAGKLVVEFKVEPLNYKTNSSEHKHH